MCGAVRRVQRVGTHDGCVLNLVVRWSGQLFFCPLPEVVFVFKWALIFFVISLVATLFGCEEIASGPAAIEKNLFYIALFILFVVFDLLAGKAIK